MVNFLLIESMCRVHSSLLISRYHGIPKEEERKRKKGDKRKFFLSVLFVILQELSLHIVHKHFAKPF